MSVRAPVLSLIVVAAGLTACFSDHTQSPTGLDGQLPDIECSVPFPTPEANEVIVGIRDFAFHPSQVTVPRGTKVTWLNCEESGIAAHTTTSDAGVWDSGLLSAAGGTFSRTFGEEGSFPYHCTPHPFMQGSVKVESP
jgi:plastocyanin